MSPAYPSKKSSVWEYHGSPPKTPNTILDKMKRSIYNSICWNVADSQTNLKDRNNRQKSGIVEFTAEFTRPKLFGHSNRYARHNQKHTCSSLVELERDRGERSNKHRKGTPNIKRASHRRTQVYHSNSFENCELEEKKFSRRKEKRKTESAGEILKYSSNRSKKKSNLFETADRRHSKFDRQRHYTENGGFDRKKKDHFSNPHCKESHLYYTLEPNCKPTEEYNRRHKSHRKIHKSKIKTHKIGSNVEAKHLQMGRHSDKESLCSTCQCDSKGKNTKKALGNENLEKHRKQVYELSKDQCKSFKEKGYIKVNVKVKPNVSVSDFNIIIKKDKSNRGNKNTNKKMGN